MLVLLTRHTDPRGWSAPFDGHLALAPGDLHDLAFTCKVDHEITAKEQQLSTPRVLCTEDRRGADAVDVDEVQRAGELTKPESGGELLGRYVIGPIECSWRLTFTSGEFYGHLANADALLPPVATQ